MKPIDPELLRQIDAHGDDHEMGAVVTVQDLAPGVKPLSPQETASVVEKLMGRIEKATGLKPTQLRVQQNLGTFLIRAKAAFMKPLLQQGEVKRAACADAIQTEPLRTGKKNAGE